jgi:hypothetical protein
MFILYSTWFYSAWCYSTWEDDLKKLLHPIGGLHPEQRECLETWARRGVVSAPSLMLSKLQNWRTAWLSAD